MEPINTAMTSRDVDVAPDSECHSKMMKLAAKEKNLYLVDECILGDVAQQRLSNQDAN